MLSDKIRKQFEDLEADYWASANGSKKPSMFDKIGVVLTDEQRKAVEAETRVWYSPNAILQRAIEYKEKVWQESEAQRYERIVNAEHAVKLAANGFALQFGKTFEQLPSFQRKTIKAMAMLHLGYKPRDLEGLSFQKGVFLSGNSQIGKTSIFNYLRNIEGFEFRIVTSYELVVMANSFQQQKLPIDSIVKEYGTKGKCLVIDEVGMEGKADYGKDIVPQIIHMRYGRGLITHYTSNKSIEDLYNRYEEHIVMRIKQGCNIIEAYNDPFLKR
jgi:DNA replication protein DnaC